VRNRLIYVRLLDFVLDHEYTIQQVRDATRQQVETITGLDTSGYSNAFLLNMREQVVGRLIQAAAVAAMNRLLELVHNNGFPNAEAQLGSEQDKIKITLWPTGKPAEVE